MVYKWKNQFNYSIPAETVGKHFEKLEEKHGELTSKNVLDSARPIKSPIHRLFEWDDTVAAEKYRLEQASCLIRNLTVEIEDENKEPLELRAYVNVTDEKSGKYINIESAFQSDESREFILNRAIAELRAFEKKYRNLMEFAKLMTVIDQEIEKLQEGA